MILRRVMAHLRKQEWTAVAIDFLIVVLVCFGYSGTPEPSGDDRRAESVYLSQLQGDLQRIESEVRDQIEFEQFQGRLAASAFDWIQHDRSADRSRRIGMALSQLTTRRTLRTESPTFVDLQSSGNLEIISDPALRAEIISYVFYTRRLEAVIERTTGILLTRVWSRSCGRRGCQRGVGRSRDGDASASRRAHLRPVSR